MSQYKTQQATSVKDYWLLKFPFAIHAGWIVAASFVNIGVVLVNYSVGETIQYYFAFATIVMLLLITAVALGYHDRPEYVVPLVLSWASVRCAGDCLSFWHTPQPSHAFISLFIFSLEFILN